MQESLQQIAPFMGTPPGLSFTATDSFRTRNQFYGGQVGTIAEYRINRWSVNLTGKLGLGVTQQKVTINGSQLTILPPGFGPPQALNFGILANQGIIGVHTRNVFSVVPEVGMNVGYNLTNNVRLMVGYNVIYWTNVVRPGNQINLAVNPTQATPRPGVPPTGPNPPPFAFNSSNFWVQGLTAGVEFRW